MTTEEQYEDCTDCEYLDGEDGRYVVVSCERCRQESAKILDAWMAHRAMAQPGPRGQA